MREHVNLKIRMLLEASSVAIEQAFKQFSQQVSNSNALSLASAISSEYPTTIEQVRAFFDVAFHRPSPDHTTATGSERYLEYHTKSRHFKSALDMGGYNVYIHIYDEDEIASIASKRNPAAEHRLARTDNLADAIAFWGLLLP